jgi:NADH-quinone oxidoreductase subunit E/NADP-reducing hydrogenase subunit HndA
MPNCMTKVPYRGTREQEEKLREVIAFYKGKPGATMPVLQQAQEIFGYLPEEVQIMIAEGLGYSTLRVNGVATFYRSFPSIRKGNIRSASALEQPAMSKAPPTYGCD